MRGARIVALDFEPAAGYWESSDGIELISQSAEYARQGATSFWLETLFSTLKPGEPAQVVVHLHNARRERLNLPLSGEAKVELLSGTTVLDTADVKLQGSGADENVYFRKPLEPGFYAVRGVYSDEGMRASSMRMVFGWRMKSC